MLRFLFLVFILTVLAFSKEIDATEAFIQDYWWLLLALAILATAIVAMTTTTEHTSYSSLFSRKRRLAAKAELDKRANNAVQSKSVRDPSEQALDDIIQKHMEELVAARKRSEKKLALDDIQSAWSSEVRRFILKYTIPIKNGSSEVPSDIIRKRITQSVLKHMKAACNKGAQDNISHTVKNINPSISQSGGVIPYNSSPRAHTYDSISSNKSALTPKTYTPGPAPIFYNPATGQIESRKPQTPLLGSQLSKKTFEKMTGIEYEHHCGKILRNSGWEVTILPPSGDQGVDIIAKKGRKVVAIQCKKYSSPVGNKAVQEVIAGKGYYDATHSAVVTNNEYTTSAQELARKLKVHLLHHEDLPNLAKRLSAIGN